MHVKLSMLKGTEPRREHGDLAALKASIQEVGLIHPPTVSEDLSLLAGRRRFQALMELYGPDHDVDVTVLPVDGDRLKAFRVAIQENLQRKSLTDPEVATAIKEYDELKREMEGERHAGGDRQSIYHTVVNASGWTQKATAQDLGVSQQAVNKAIKIATALETYPELAHKRNGQAVLREAQRRKSASSTPPPETGTTRYKIITGDFGQLWQGWEPESFDLVVTDPPYDEKQLPLYEVLGQASAALLRPTGSLLVMTGQSHLGRVMTLLDRCLTYHWTLAYLTPGGQAVHMRFQQVNTFWKPVLWYRKATYLGPCVGDVIKSAVNDNDKTHHAHGQSESGFADLLQRFVQPGMSILDPFMGAGTTGVVALRNGCSFVGVDKDESNVKIARERLQGV